jgi:hypothetical protein
MPVNKNIDQETLENLEISLTADLDKIREDVLYRASKIIGHKVSVPSLHGLIGGKNNV